MMLRRMDHALALKTEFEIVAGAEKKFIAEGASWERVCLNALATVLLPLLQVSSRRSVSSRRLCRWNR